MFDKTGKESSKNIDKNDNGWHNENKVVHRLQGKDRNCQNDISGEVFLWTNMR